MEFDCHIVASNNADFVIAEDVKAGQAPLLLSGANGCFVSDFNFDIDECCQNDASFRVKLKKTQDNLKKSFSLQEKFEIMQNFFESSMPLCEPKNLDERTTCFFDGEPFSYMVGHGYCMCAERATMAQYLCQQCEIKSYLVNSIVEISNGEKGQHAYVIFEKDNHMYVYDPANPMKNYEPRLMDSNMEKVIFKDFMDAVNENADVHDRMKKRCVGFVCRSEDGKKFRYRSCCGSLENRVTPSRLKEARLAKAMESSKNVVNTDQVNG